MFAYTPAMVDALPEGTRALALVIRQVLGFLPYTQFIGITQHNLYHAGPLALLKKALGFQAGGAAELVT